MYLICIQWKIQINKLGQRQSQTPFSSAFWFLNQNLIKRSCNIICPKRFCAKKDQTNFESIIFLVKKMWVQKELGSQKDLGQNRIQFKNNFWSKKFLFQKHFWSKKFLVQKHFWSKKIFGPKIFVVQKNLDKKKLGPKKFGVQKNLVPKSFGSKKNWVKKIWV